MSDWNPSCPCGNDGMCETCNPPVEPTCCERYAYEVQQRAETERDELQRRINVMALEYENVCRLLSESDKDGCSGYWAYVKALVDSGADDPTIADGARAGLRAERKKKRALEEEDE